jgi:N-acetylneuraminate synthase
MNIFINKHKIGNNCPTYIVAELSANHHQKFEKAVKLIKAAKEAGADAVKLQTYTPDTLTIACENDLFKVRGTIWEGKTLFDLYKEAYTPWEWQPKLKKIADDIGIDLFSTPFDPTALDFLEKMEIPAYKIASFEVLDIPLIQKIARTGKPIIMSIGMATLAEVQEAVTAIQNEGNDQLALLKCTSAYPAPPEDMNLVTIPHIAESFNVVAGLSDHTLGSAIPIAAVSLGARIIEKHFTLTRSTPGPDSPFSLEPHEFEEMVQAVRNTEKAMGKIHYGVSKNEEASLHFRRSLFVVQDIKAGEKLTTENVRSIRPGYGMHPRHYGEVVGKCARQDIQRGTPLSWNLLITNKEK